MYEPSKRLPPRTENSRDTQVLRSIDAPSTYSIEHPDPEPLMRLLMLSIEIDRKDVIIRELMELASGQDQQRIIEQLRQRCTAYEVEMKILSQTVAMLKENISSIEVEKQRHVFTSVTQFSEELQIKVTHLQVQLRRTQEEKIDLEEQLKQLKLNQTLAEFNSFKNQHNEKGRVRELQTILSAERTRADNDRKALAEKNQLLEEFKRKVTEYENRQRTIVEQYENKIRTFHSEMVFHENLKKSQMVTTEERLSLQQQQTSTLQQDIQTLKQALQQLRQANIKKDQELARANGQLNRATSQLRNLESKYMRFESQNKDLSIKLQSKLLELKTKQKQHAERTAIVHKLTTEIDQLKFSFASHGQEAHLYSQEAQRLKQETMQMEQILEEQRLQLRKLKRKPLGQPTLCQGCKARECNSSTLIASQKSIRTLNIGQIIEQTEQLFKSNRKIELLINKHDSNTTSTINLYQSHANDL